MGQHELLKHVCELLERLGIRYMVTGSHASIAYGEPRFTNDIDIVADLNAGNMDAFCDGFPADEYYLSRIAAREALAGHGMFNVIHPTSGLKIDVIVPKLDGFDQARLDRAIPVRVADDLVVRLATPEDIILKKLEWRQMGGGERHLRDIVGILKVQGDRLDLPYVETHASTLGVRELWDEIVGKLH